MTANTVHTVMARNKNARRDPETIMSTYRSQKNAQAECDRWNAANAKYGIRYWIESETL